MKRHCGERPKRDIAVALPAGPPPIRPKSLPARTTRGSKPGEMPSRASSSGHQWQQWTSSSPVSPAAPASVACWPVRRSVR